MDLLLSRVGLFDVEPNRNQAVRRLLKTKETECWYQNDQGLRFLSKQPPALPIKAWHPDLTSRLVDENGFDRSQRACVMGNSGLIITRHALQRWHQRAQTSFLNLTQIKKISEDMASYEILDGLNLPHESNPDLFYPTEHGAFIVVKRIDVLNWNSLSTLKQYSTMGIYQHNKNKNRIVGSYLPIDTQHVVKTFLGWDELEQGGIYNSFDWYKEQFAWNRVPAGWNALLERINV